MPSNFPLAVLMIGIRDTSIQMIYKPEDIKKGMKFRVLKIACTEEEYTKLVALNEEIKGR